VSRRRVPNSNARRDALSPGPERASAGADRTQEVGAAPAGDAAAAGYGFRVRLKAWVAFGVAPLAAWMVTLYVLAVSVVSAQTISRASRGCLRW